ncbi:MAG: BF3164 family lipoprotein [Mongoliitalea sp.]
MKKLFPVFLIFICLSCSNQEHIKDITENIKTFSEADLPKALLLKGEKMDFQEFLFPRHIQVTKDYIVVAENANNDIFYIYSKKDKDFVKSMGRSGMGPNEILTADFIHQGLEANDFWSYDSKNQTFNKFDIDNNISGLADLQIRQNETLAAVSSFTPLTINSFITREMHSASKFTEFTFDGKTLRSFGEWDEHRDSKDFTNFVLFTLYQGKLVASSKKDYIVACGSLIDFLEIINLETEERLFIKGPSNHFPEFELINMSGYAYPALKDSFIQYNSVFAGEKTIYALYSGLSSVANKEATTSRVFTFNLSGEILSNFELDYKIVSFTIDESENKLYGLTRDAEPNVVIYKLPD